MKDDKWQEDFSSEPIYLSEKLIKKNKKNLLKCLFFIVILLIKTKIYVFKQ